MEFGQLGDFRQWIAGANLRAVFADIEVDLLKLHDTLQQPHNTL
jgi:hypothetical protein